MSDQTHILKINKNCLGIDESGYIELPGVCGAVFGLARPTKHPFPGTYRQLMEITAVYPTSEDIPTEGEVFDLATKVSLYSDILDEFEEGTWEGSEYDWIIEFPEATVFLMSKKTDGIYREKFPNEANEEQSLIMG